MILVPGERRMDLEDTKGVMIQAGERVWNVETLETLQDSQVS